MLLAALILGLSVGVAAVAQAPPQGPDLLKKGIAQVEEGDLENAVITLDDAVRRLSTEAGHEKDLATAHLYLAMAHLGLSRVENAKAEVLAAWRSNKELTLDRGKFPPTIIDMYEAARKEMKAKQDQQAKPATVKQEPATQTPPKQDAKKEEPKKAEAGEKHGSKAPLWIGLGVAAVGGGVAAVAAGGKGTSSTSPTPRQQPGTATAGAIANPTPQPDDFVLVSLDPPARSTIPRRSLITLNGFAYCANARRIHAWAFVDWHGVGCCGRWSTPTDCAPGVPAPLSVTLTLGDDSVDSLTVDLHTADAWGYPGYFVMSFPVQYTVK
jgi:hypothetical protein